MNKALEATLSYYLDSADPAHSAILLAGAWGTGKTHFIKRFMAERLAALKARNGEADRIYLYVTLNGVQTFEEVQNQFFGQTNPVMNSSAMKLVGTVALRAVNILAGGAALEAGDAQQFLKRDISHLILVFDDLERCAMPIPEIMGFINNFVEHEGMKVIIVASEADIPEGQQPDYRQRKEKLVGKTLLVRSEHPVVYDHFVGLMRCKAAKDAAHNAKASVLRTFENSKTSNLRSLRAVIEDFDRLVDGVDAALANKPEALQRVLLFMVAAGMEFRAARLSPAQLSEFGSTLLRSHYLGKRDELPEAEKGVMEIAGRYPEVNWLDPVVPSEALADLFGDGVLHVDIINTAIRQHPMVGGVQHGPTWRRLWRWFETGQETYLQLRRDILTELGAGTFTHPALILHVAGIILELKKHGDDLLDPVDPVTFFKAYIAAREADHTLEPNRDWIDARRMTGYEGLAFSGADTEGFAEIRAELEAATLRAVDADNRARAGALVRQIVEDRESYAELYENAPRTAQIAHLPILHFTGVGTFVDSCIEDGSLNEQLIGALMQRYKRDEHRNALIAEHDWVQQVIAELRQRAENLPAPFASRIYSEIGYWVADVEGLINPGA